MTPLTELAAWKLLLLALAALAGLAFVLWFAWHYAQELLRSLRVRRSSRCHAVAADYHVRPEWTIKDPPAWERVLPQWQASRLANDLRRFHQ